MKGKIVGFRYKILEYLAEGGFGKTYLAEDTQLPGKDICVVKQLYPSSGDPKFLKIARRLFKTEASTLHNLGHHEQIPELLAYFEDEEKFYLVQQYIEGETLGKRLDGGKIWSESQVTSLLRDGLNILEFVHRKGVIHRDVKPDNLILRKSDEKLVLVDFGTVKEVLKGQQTNIGQLTVAVGTQGYMPTEQARGKPRPTSDLYALGIICIQALTGIVPLELPEDDEGEIVWQSSAPVSRGLAAILTKMTRYHFKDRYQSATEVLQALDKLLGSNVTKPQSVTAIYSENYNRSKKNKVQKNISHNSKDKHVVLPKTNHSPNSTSPNSKEKLANPKQSTPQHLEATVINSPAAASASVRTHNKPKLIGYILAAIATAIIGAGAYFLIQQRNTEPTNTPSKTTPRQQQGDGFRPDL